MGGFSSVLAAGTILAAGCILADSAAGPVTVGLLLPRVLVVRPHPAVRE